MEVVSANIGATLFGTDIISRIRDSRATGPIDLLAKLIPWWAKVVILLAGLRYKTLGLAYLILDGRFHWTASPERLRMESPDWILADLLGLGKGFGVTVHRLIGLGLMLGSAWVLYDVYFRRGAITALTTLHLGVVLPVTLVIIAAGITVKNLIWKPQQRGDGRVAFL